MRMWALDPAIAHLNHGSFGACPVPVLDAQRAWRHSMERNPTLFLGAELPQMLETTRRTLAAFLGAESDGLVFVPNATTGVNAVLRSLEPGLTPGDEIVVLDHAYNACRNAVEATAGRTGARPIVAEVPFPGTDLPRAVESVLRAVTGRTRLVVLDHVTSTTALVLPVEEIVAALEPDVPVLVDGAHAPGMVPLEVDALGASFYTGNCHKWMCAPKGAAFLWVRSDHRDRIVPVTISHGWRGEFPAASSRFKRMFDWTGTADPTPWLCIPTAIDTMSGLAPDGWTGVMAANRGLALSARDVLCARLGIDPPAPDDMIGSMATLPLPGDPPDELIDPLTAALRERWAIEVPVFGGTAPRQRLVRISAQRYNQPAQYERLADALDEELALEATR